MGVITQVEVTCDWCNSAIEGSSRFPAVVICEDCGKDLKTEVSDLKAELKDAQDSYEGEIAELRYQIGLLEEKLVALKAQVDGPLARAVAARLGAVS